MKKYIGFMVLTSLVFSFTLSSIAKAEDGSNDGTTTNSGPGGTKPPRPMMNADLKEKRDAFIEQMKANREALKEKIQTERKDFLDKLKADKETFLADLKTKKEEWKTANAARKAQFCDNAREMLKKRFEFVVSQLEKYQTTVSGMIDKLKAEGKDTTVAEDALTLSKQKLADAKAKMDEIKGLIPESGCPDVTSDAFATVKAGARDAKDLLKASREALHEAVKAIRDLRGEDKQEGSDNNNNENSGTQE